MLRRVKVLSQFVAIELVVQSFTWISGILLIRVLDQHQYAYYTIANTMQSTMNLLADLGIGASLSALGGKVWQDRYRFGQLINTAMQLRFYLAGISLTIITPVLLWMLVRGGASFPYALLITIAVLVGVNFQLTTGVLEIVPRLHSQINQIQNLNLLSTVTRLALLGIAYLSVLNAAIAVTIAAAIQGLQRFFYEKWASAKIDREAPVDKTVRQFTLKTIKDVAPNCIFFCLQGQLTVLLISIFGSTQSIAEVGALGRIGAIFVVLNSILQTIILPSFSRCQSVSLLWRRYYQVVGCFLGVGLTLIGITVFFPNAILWLLGKNYAHLQSELVLMTTSTVVGSVVGVMSLLNLSKAWVEYSWIEVPTRIGLQVVLLLILDVSTVRGVLLFSLISNLSPFLINSILAYRGLTSYRESTSS